MINSIKIKESLKDKKINIIYKEETESTNTDLKALALNGAEAGTTVIAAMQRGGRGRLGRSFCSPKGGGLYLSYLIKPIKIPPEDIVRITAAVSVVVTGAVEKVVGIFPKIKWVNDIIYKNKKICGILCETVWKGRTPYIVIGIGMNLRRVSIPDELLDIVGFINDFKSDFDEDELAKEIILGLYELEDIIINKKYIKKYKEKSCLIGKEIFVIKNTKEEAIALDIDENGGLLVRYKNGAEEVLSSGEVSIKIKEDKNYE